MTQGELTDCPVSRSKNARFSLLRNEPGPPRKIQSSLKECLYDRTVVNISWTAEIVENVVPPLSVCETYVNKQLLLVTTNSQTCKLQTITNFSYILG